MFSSPTPAPGSRTLASNALRKAGLIDRDRDSKMRDATDKPGGRKGASKFRAHRPRAIDAFKDQGPSRSLVARSNTSQPGSSDPLSIRGASRPTALGRLRRNAGPGPSTGPSLIPVHQRGATLKNSVEPWRKLVQKRWNPEIRLLDLSNMIEDEIVKKYNLMPPGYGGNARDAAVLFKLASQLKPEVQSLDLSRNRLQGQHLSLLGHYLPQLANLSLQDNDFKTYRDMDFMSGKKDKLVALRELILSGNPLREDAMKKDAEKFKIEVSRRFPSLAMLDGQTIAQISFDVSQTPIPSGTVEKPSATTFPVEMGASFIVGVDGSLLSTFLSRFFSAFDTQRAALQDVYDAAATFSYSCNTSIPERARIQGLQHKLPNQKKLEWAPWLSIGAAGSRNLLRLAQSPDKQVQRLLSGGPAIAKAVEALPKTRHDISGPPEKFCVDCFPVVHAGMMGLLVVVHGEFTELPSEGLRSFDRTFILIPAPDGSRAKLSGWDVVIISDQWTIRAYSSFEAWRPGPMVVQPDKLPPRQLPKDASVNVLSKLTPEQQAVLNSIPEPQRSLVVQVCARTGLNVQFAIDCLTSNGWDFEKAVNNFNEVKGTLSRDAFL